MISIPDSFITSREAIKCVGDNETILRCTSDWSLDPSEVQRLNLKYGRLKGSWSTLIGLLAGTPLVTAERNRFVVKGSIEPIDRYALIRAFRSDFYPPQVMASVFATSGLDPDVGLSAVMCAHGRGSFKGVPESTTLKVLGILRQTLDGLVGDALHAGPTLSKDQFRSIVVSFLARLRESIERDLPEEGGILRAGFGTDYLVSDLLHLFVSAGLLDPFDSDSNVFQVIRS